MSNEAKKVWTREEIEAMVRTNDRAVERAMVAIWERQTAEFIRWLEGEATC